MCLNFLGLIHLDSHVTSVNNRIETSYTKVIHVIIQIHTQFRSQDYTLCVIMVLVFHLLLV